MDEVLSLFDPTLPLSQASTIPSLWYRDSRVADLERERVFGRSWLAVGDTSSLLKSGDFFTADMMGEPVLVAREKDTVRAFYNVCRHRGASVTSELKGAHTCFRCPYHGWTYDLDGSLRTAPELGGVEHFLTEENGLIPIQSAIWNRFIFVNLHGTAPLQTWLAPVPQLLENVSLTSLRYVGRRSYDVECNWKAFTDNYLDGGYHIPHVHPGLAGMIDYSRYRTEMGEWSSVQISPMDREDLQGETAKLSLHRRGDNAFYAWIFPNFMINAYEGYMDTNFVIPLSTHRCRVVYDFYFDPETPESEIEQSIAVSESIQQEDGDICASVQRGLASEAFTSGRYSIKREGPVYHFHQLLARCLLEQA